MPNKIDRGHVLKCDGGGCACGCGWARGGSRISTCSLVIGSRGQDGRNVFAVGLVVVHELHVAMKHGRFKALRYFHICVANLKELLHFRILDII